MRHATLTLLAVFVGGCGPKQAPPQPPSSTASTRVPDEAAPIPGSEEYPDAESLPPQPEGDWIVALSGDAAPIKGVVLDKEGKPWAQVEVVFAPQCGEAMLGFTNDKGEFEGRSFPRCLTEITAQKDGANHEVEVLPGEKPVQLTLTPKCNKHFAAPCPDRAGR